MHDLGSAQEITARLPAVTQGSARSIEGKEEQVYRVDRRKMQTQTKNTARPPGRSHARIVVPTTAEGPLVASSPRHTTNQLLVASY